MQSVPRRGRARRRSTCARFESPGRHGGRCPDRARPSRRRARPWPVASLLIAIFALGACESGSGGDDTPDRDPIDAGPDGSREPTPDAAADAASDAAPDAVPDAAPIVFPEACQGDRCDCAEAAVALRENLCYAQAAAAEPGGDVVVVGYIHPDDGAPAWVARFAPGGGVRWSHGLQEGRGASSVTATPGSRWVVGGRTSGQGDALQCSVPWLAGLDPHGRIVWQRTIPACGRVKALATLGGGDVVAAVTADGIRLVATNASDGSALWSSLVPESRAGDQPSGLFVDDDDVVHLSAVLSPQSATPRGLFARYAPDGDPLALERTELSDDGRVTAGPLGGTDAELRITYALVGPHEQSRIERVDADGHVAWSIPTPPFELASTVVPLADGAMFTTKDLTRVMGISSDGVLRFVQSLTEYPVSLSASLAARPDGRAVLALNHFGQPRGTLLTTVDADGDGPLLEPNCGWPQVVGPASVLVNLHARDGMIHLHRRRRAEGYEVPYATVLGADGHRRDTRPLDAPVFEGALIASSAPIAGGWLFAGLRDERAWAARVDFDGTVRWTLPEAQSAELFAIGLIAPTADGGWSLAADRRPVPGSTHGPIARLLRFDADGALLWAREYGDPEREHTRRSLAALPDGGFALGGDFGVAGGGARRRPYVLRVDADGEQRWLYESPPLDDFARVVAALPLVDGGVVVFETGRVVRMRDGEIDGVLVERAQTYRQVVADGDGFVALVQDAEGAFVVRFDAALGEVERWPVPDIFLGDILTGLAVIPEGYVVLYEDDSADDVMLVIGRDGAPLCATLR